MIFPVLNPRDGKPLADLYRLVFPNAITIYYSYQVPIAFLSRDKLHLRKEFWVRRRGLRNIHTKVIAEDSASINGTDSAYSDEFFADLREEMDFYGLVFAGGGMRSAYTAKQQKAAKRRIVL